MADASETEILKPLLDRLSYFVPDEICVVLAGPIDDDEYDRLHADLNRELLAAPHLATPAEALFDELFKEEHAGRRGDPNWDALRRALIADLAAAGAGDARDGRDDWPLARIEHAARWSNLEVRGSRKAPTALACFKVVAPGGGEAQDDPFVRTRALLTRLHFRVLPTLRARGRTGPAIAAVSPHWIVGAAGPPQFCPSPGAIPVPIGSQPKGKWTFEFDVADDDLEGAIATGRLGRQLVPTADTDGCEVVVAVLDTCPTPTQIIDAAGRCGPNELLRDVVYHADLTGGTRITLDSPLSLTPREIAAIDHYSLNWLLEPIGETLKMQDHGLFITGIIHDIAPRARIELIRVLNGYGVTTLSMIAPVLERLTDHALQGDPKRRLIVNLSLGASIPPGEQLLRVMLPHVHEALLPQLRTSPDVKTALEALGWGLVQGYIDELQASVRAILDWIRAHPQVLVVAAAGNDNGHFFSLPAPDPSRPTRPEPRWPAADDDVLSVAALDLAGSPAEYSNRGDIRVLGNGVAVWGGQARSDATGKLGAIAVGKETDAIAGIYSAQHLPTYADDGTIVEAENSSGWAYWAGTSFATPIVAGLAAALWTADPTLGPRGIIERITRSLADLPQSPTDSDRLDCPGIRARQRFIPA